MLRKIFILLMICMLALPLVASAHESSEIVIGNVWAAPSVAGQPTFISLSIRNPAGHPIGLMAASSPAAMTAAIVQDGMLSDQVTIAADASMDGAMIGLTGLKRPLVAGDAISLTLTFAMLETDKEPITITTAVLVADQRPAASDFAVILPWVRPTVAAMPSGEDGHSGHGGTATAEAPMSMGGVTALYFTLVNNGTEEDTLLSATATGAGMVQIHETIVENDVAQMRELTNGIVIPAGGSAELRPRGNHVMLMELQRDYAPGDAIVVTLTFASGRTLTFAAPVYDLVMSSMGHNHS
jgi:periplasmic copper chaperone A